MPIAFQPRLGGPSLLGLVGCEDDCCRSHASGVSTLVYDKETWSLLQPVCGQAFRSLELEFSKYLPYIKIKSSGKKRKIAASRGFMYRWSNFSARSCGVLSMSTTSRVSVQGSGDSKRFHVGYLAHPHTRSECFFPKISRPGQRDHNSARVP